MRAKKRLGTPLWNLVQWLNEGQNPGMPGYISWLDISGLTWEMFEEGVPVATVYKIAAKGGPCKIEAAWKIRCAMEEICRKSSRKVVPWYLGLEELFNLPTPWEEGKKR